MKHIKIIFPFCAALSFALSAPHTLPHAKITIRVLGEQKEPIANATVTFVFLQASDDKEAPVAGLTDADGSISREGTSLNMLSGNIVKDGYYRSSFETKQFESAVDGKWLPWNQAMEVVIHKVVKPIPLYAKKVSTGIPTVDDPTGYDLVEGDWVAPYGRGKSRDLIFTLTRHWVNNRNYDANLKIGFSSSDDGIQSWDNSVSYYSALKMPRLAPENGYVALLALANRRIPGASVERDFRKERNYFFRIRTVRDDKGKVVSAQFGKIDGDIRFSPIRSETSTLMFNYYLNPNTNDRNLEFDVQHNLVTHLRDEDRVSAP